MFVFVQLRRDWQWGGDSVCRSQLSFHPYILHAEGQPWTANLPRWREKSLHLVNMQIRWEREMKDTGGMMTEGENIGWRVGGGEGNVHFLVPFRWTVLHCPALTGLLILQPGLTAVNIAAATLGPSYTFTHTITTSLSPNVNCSSPHGSLEIVYFLFDQI